MTRQVLITKTGTYNNTYYEVSFLPESSEASHLNCRTYVMFHNMDGESTTILLCPSGHLFQKLQRHGANTSNAAVTGSFPLHF